MPIFGSQSLRGLRIHFALMMVFAGGIAFWTFLALVYSGNTTSQITVEQFKFALPFATVLLVMYAMLLFRAARTMEQHGFLRGLANRICSLSNNGYLVVDVNKQNVYLSHSLLKLLGLQQTGQSVAQSAFAALVHREDQNYLAEMNAWAAKQSARGSQRASDSEPATFEIRLRHANGQWCATRLVASVIPPKESGQSPAVLCICTDIAAERSEALQRQSADARLRDAIDSLPQSFALRDSQNRLVVCNQQFLSLHGIPAERAYSGAPYAELLELAANDPTSRAMVAESANGNSRGGSHTIMQLLDNRWFACYERRTHDGGRVLIETDITQIKEQEQILERQAQSLRAAIAEQRELTARYRNEKDRAEGASRAKSAFLANVSHELRTPLTAVLGFAEVLQRQSFGAIGSTEQAQEKYSQYVEDIMHSGQQLLELIEGILDMSRIEAGKLDLNIRPVNVSEVVRSCLRTVSASREVRNIGLKQTLRLRRNLPCDEHALRQIVLNLLANAIKFGKSGGTIGVRTGVTKGYGYVEVSDDGIGMDSDLLPKIGEPFLKGAHDSTCFKGTGLGLALCHKLVAIHEGQIEINSEKGKGTKVKVLLPLSHPVSAPSNDANDDSGIGAAANARGDDDRPSSAA